YLISFRIARSRVVLPAPLGPISATSWPRGSSRLTSSTSLRPPALTVTCSHFSRGSVAKGLQHRVQVGAQHALKGVRRGLADAEGVQRGQRQSCAFGNRARRGVVKAR